MCCEGEAPLLENVLSVPVHRHSDLHPRFRARFGHEEEVLGTQKSLEAGGNGLTFDASCLSDF